MYETRMAYAETLVKLGSENDRIVAIDADLSKATRTTMFQEVYPKRFFNVGIAEANMMCVAAGMAYSGFIPFATTLAVFAAGRGYEQIRNSICYPKLNVKVVGTHGGIIVGADGGSHQSVEDIAIMRALPNMTVICPGDAVETRKAVRAITEMQGPVYLRLGRLETPVIFDEDYNFNIGKSVIIREGTDLTIVSTGTLTPTCLQVVDTLKKENKGTIELIHAATVKPLDEDTIVASARKTGHVLTVEDGTIFGGIGSAVAECLARRCPTSIVIKGVPDRFGESGNADELLRAVELDYYGILSAALRLLVS